LLRVLIEANVSGNAETNINKRGRCIGA